MGLKVFVQKEKWVKRMENGSYTIEAVFVVPIVLGISFLILYTLFLQHDRVILQANLDNVLFLAAEGDSDCMQDYESYLRKSLWCMEVQEAELSDGQVWVRGKVTAEAFWKIPVLSYLIAGQQRVSLSESYGRLQPEEILRYGADFMRKHSK